ncbi:MAG: ABC transporter permease [Clostridia bacterium]|nr:ABC transporter permease [Clostridia bacterium]
MRENLKFILTKAVEFILTLLVVSFFTFAAFSILPGDTASVILGPEATPEQIDSLRQELGLDKPMVEQYLNWLAGTFSGNLGQSTTFNVPVSSLIAQRLPVTLGMCALALIIVIGVSYPMAILSSRKPFHLADQVFSIIGHIAFAIPPFVLSLLLILLFSNLFGYFAVGQYYAPTDNFGGYLNSLLLPSVCIAIPKIAMIFKFLRSSIITEKASDYIKTSKAHGLSDFSILIRHVLPNTNVSAITVVSIVLSDIIGGSLIVEQVFNLPGLGRLLLMGISRRDFPLLSGMVFYLALATVIIYFVADILNNLVDPRMRLK